MTRKSYRQKLFVPLIPLVIAAIMLYGGLLSAAASLPANNMTAESGKIIETMNASAGTCFLRCLQILIGSVDPDALKIPARRAECSLAENARSPFHAEPEHMDNDSFRRWLTDTVFGLTYRQPAAGA